MVAATPSAGARLTAVTGSTATQKATASVRYSVLLRRTFRTISLIVATGPGTCRFSPAAAPEVCGMRMIKKAASAVAAASAYRAAGGENQAASAATREGPTVPPSP